MDFEQKRKYKKLFYSKPVIIALLFLFLFVTKATWNVYQKMELSKENLELVKNDLEKLKVREEALASQIDYLHTEQGVEAEIRQKYRVIKEGEEIAVIIDDENDEDNVASTTNQSLWAKFKGIFE